MPICILYKNVLFLQNEGGCMVVIAYVYESAYHCINCTKERFAYGVVDVDYNGVPEYAVDKDGNIISAVFDGTECDYQPGCDDCNELIEGIEVL